MAGKGITFTPELSDYLVAHSTPLTPAIPEVLAETKRQWAEFAQMSISHDQCVFMDMMTRLIKPHVVVEIGTFSGASSLAVAGAMSENAHMHCFDRSEDFTDVAQHAWERAGVAHKIDLHLGDALDGLNTYCSDAEIDMCFIDADKTNYLHYYHFVIERLTTSGAILVDNVLWSGAVLDDDVHDADTRALQQFNAHVVNDPRVTVAMLNIGDGVSVIRLA